MRTPFCDLLGIEVPIMLAPFGPWAQVDLAAAVCNAGALGSVGTAIREPADLRRQWEHLRELTDRPFAVNHTGRPFDPAVFDAILAARPAAVSFHLGVPAGRIAEAHSVGARWIQQVGDLRGAEQALEAGADVLVAQGWEAGGHAGWVGTMVLVPQLVDLAGEVPVLAAGGIADGRGVAAALALGAQGVLMGTRFLASSEMGIDPVWKERIVAADATEAVKVTHSEYVLPPFTLDLPPGPPPAPRALRTPLIDQLAADPGAVDAAEFRATFMVDVRANRGHDVLPFTGQSAALVHDVAPAAEIISRLLAETETALQAARRAVSG
ncbi:NAD(P)H-dependent flavin oxidoreductase [Pseudofrankia asymbiotica]|uniref:2-nitropropane dioxygenase n=1 Tax=Pseudofrankia asymbiotica TaxID=1834516 RepID=A0A1V2I9X7_9ACTN|nr:nitronate monooxygenase [Pseudofrankia asymbiotica]ONH29469.1 2-nitropropane dioxygenase [Pseudofrankia asymbiotica]